MLVERQGARLANPGFEQQARRAESPGLGLDRRQQRGAQALAPQAGPDVHPLDLGGRRIEPANRAAANGRTIAVDSQEGAVAVSDLRGIEPEVGRSLLGIGGAELFVELGDQLLGVGREDVASLDPQHVASRAPGTGS